MYPTHTIKCSCFISESWNLRVEFIIQKGECLRKFRVDENNSDIPNFIR